MELKCDHTTTLPPPGKPHRHTHRDYTSDREHKRQQAVRRHNSVKTPQAFRGQARAMSAGLSRSMSVKSAHDGHSSAELLAEAERVANSRALSTTPISRKILREKLLDNRACRSAENSPATVRKPLSKHEHRDYSTPSPGSGTHSLTNVTLLSTENGMPRPVSNTPPSVRRTISFREQSFTGQTYSYVGQSQLSTRKNRPYAARASRAVSFKEAQNGVKPRDVTEEFCKRDVTGDTPKQVASTPPNARRVSSLMEHIDRSRVCTSTENSPALPRKAADKPTRAASLRLSQSTGGWCNTRGLPPALLTDMHLFRKLYMVQLEKEARREVEAQYARQKLCQQSRDHDTVQEQALATASSPHTPQANNLTCHKSFKDLHSSPRVSILKQTEAPDARLVVKSSTSATRKRVSFSAEYCSEMSL